MAVKFTPKVNFTGPGTTTDTTYSNFGLTVYKQYESGLGRNVSLSEHLANGYIEMCVGAHYYAHGAYTTAYTKAGVTVDLSTIQLDTKSRRVACVSLNVSGVGACDMGIENAGDGKGWFCFYWSTTHHTAGPKKYAPAGTTKVVMSVEGYCSNGKDIIKGTFKWSGGSAVTDTQEFSAPAGGLFVLENSKPKFRLERFMSLVPKDGLGYTPETDTADGSFLKNVKFATPYLYNGSTKYVWDASKLDYIWSVQGWNISQCSVGNGDSFSCAHEHYVY